MLVMTFKKHVRSHRLILRPKYVWSHMELIFLARFSHCISCLHSVYHAYALYCNQLTHSLSNSLNIHDFQRENALYGRSKYTNSFLATTPTLNIETQLV